MEGLNDGPISMIEEIPGLCISDISIPRSGELLREHGITHVLSLTNQKDLPAIEAALGIQRQHLAIEDNPYEDILMSLEGVCAWVNHALATSVGNSKVLVHCKQGTSRSGAVIIALLMHRNRSLDYESALALARKSRPSIAPNSGFADQLRLWRETGYSVSEGVGDGGPRKPKVQYEEWRRDRGVLLTKDEEARQEAVRKAMEDMAVTFGGGSREAGGLQRHLD